MNSTALWTFIAVSLSFGAAYADEPTHLPDDLARLGISCSTKSCKAVRPPSCNPEASEIIEWASASNLPSCRTLPANRLILPSPHLPLSAVFFTCQRNRQSECIGLAEAILKADSKVRVNLFMPANSMSDPNFVSALVKLGPKVQVLPVEGSPDIGPPVFSRDLGYFSISANGPVYIQSPYGNQSLGSTASTLFEEVSEACHLNPSVRPYATAAEINQLVDQILKLKSPAYLKYDENPKRTARWQADVQFGKYFESQTGAGAMGGNFLGLPGGGIAVGKSDNSDLTPELEEFYTKQQPVIHIPIPVELSVGHIDEVFTIVPNPAHDQNSCDYAVLRASPRAFTEVLGPVAMSSVGLSAQQIDEIESLLEKSTASLLGFLKEQLKQTCRIPVIPLPARFSELGAPLSFNPINGLNVNGTFLVSKPQIYDDSVSDSVRLKLEERVTQELAQIGMKVAYVSTLAFDHNGGNLHCGTSEIRVACRPDGN